ncbi:MAG TPA: alpha-amylase family protein, partial [Acidisarcina sp.]
AEYSMTDAEFNAVMPNEFWREVVDRVAAEVPGTLLLAEAFWLMEGYFVRTLGMHRVYNSAFMVMLRDEDNANYRTVLKKTLEFDPDIMKRYVNFMSNPDERTTIDQFGDGDKCFGVAALMATLPGLPMFGHGQVEGYTEKYGMEYRRPRYDETASPWLVERHLRQIAPLLHQRWLFAESSNFRLYDFVRDDGVVEEDVFAYSNRAGDKHAVVVYNNRYSSAHGRIDTSAAYADKGSGEQRQQRLRESLGFADEPDVILAYRDSLTGLEYLRRGDEVASRGLRIDLQGYQCHVFLDWRELRATAEKPWDRLCDQLGGRGVPDLESALVNLELQPAHDALRALLQPSLLQRLASLAAPSRVPGTAIEMEDNEEEGLVAPQLAAAVLMHDSKDSIAQFFSQVASLHSVFKDRSLAAYQVLGRASGDFDQALVTETGRLGEDGLGGDGLGQEGVRADPVRDFGVQDDLKALMRLPDLEARLGQPLPPGARGVIPSSSPSVPGAGSWAAAFSWMLIGRLAYSLGREDREAAALDLYERLRLREPLAKAFVEAGLAPDESWRAAARVRVLLLAEAGPARSTNSATPGAGASESLKQGLEAGELVSTPAAVLDAGTKQNSADQATASSRSAKGAGGEVKHAEPSRGILQKSTQDSRNGAKPAPSNEEDKDNSPAAPGVPTTGRVERVAALNLCSPELWQDGDVRWLLGLHEHAGVSYFSKEGFEELAWWLQLPALLDEEAEDPAEKPQHSGYGPLAALERTMRAAEEAGYRLDVFLGAEAARASGGPDKEPAPAVLSAERGSEAGEEEPGPQRKLAQS